MLSGEQLTSSGDTNEISKLTYNQLYLNIDKCRRSEKREWFENNFMLKEIGN